MKKRALIHVENTENIIEFAKFLTDNGWEIITANKTEELLTNAGIPVTTERSLIFNGYYQLLNFELMGKILNTKKMEYSESYQNSEDENNIYIICVNFYPEVNYNPNKKQMEELLHPQSFYYSSIIRNGYTNSSNILVLTDPEDYKEAMIQLKTDSITKYFRTYLAAKAINLLSAYDGALSNSLFFGHNSEPFIDYLTFPFKKFLTLENGANSQQQACLYKFPESVGILSGIQKSHGKPISYRTAADISIIWEQISSLSNYLKTQFSVRSTTCDGYEYTTQFSPITESVFTIAVKLNSILSSSLASNAYDSFKKTYTYDTYNIDDVSIGFSCVVDEQTAAEIVRTKITAVVAPAFTDGAKEILSHNEDILLVPTAKLSVSAFDLQLLNGGLLLQTKDSVLFDHWYVKTSNRPDQYMADQMAFGMVLAMATRSYSAILLRNNSIIGISQAAKSSNRSVDFCFGEAKEYLYRNTREDNRKNFIPDLLVCDSKISLTPTIKDLIGYGLKAIIQTGGSVNDEEFINYCNEHGVIMIFTGTTHITY